VRGCFHGGFSGVGWRVSGGRSRFHFWIQNS